jgi:hypothetical protein
MDLQLVYQILGLGEGQLGCFRRARETLLGEPAQFGC